MKFLRLSPTGHLWLFRAVPPDLAADTGPWPEPGWSRLFDLAGLDVAGFQPADPIWAAPFASDVRRAWVNPSLADVRIEAAAFRGRPVWFEIIPAWKPVNQDLTATPGPPLVIQIVSFALLSTVILGAALMARRNFRLRRGDPRGATRLALLVVGLGTGFDFLSTSSSAGAFFGVWSRNLALQVWGAASVWVFYMALEPYVRRLWPDTLIAWSRMLEGRLRDPMVGRHLLFGALAGMVFSSIDMLPTVATWFGMPPPDLGTGGLDALGGFRHLVAEYFNIVRTSFFVPVIVLMTVLLLRVVLKKPWLAYLVFFGALLGILALNPAPWSSKAQGMLMLSFAVVVLTRLGLFAMLVGVAFSSWGQFPLTLDPASWYFPYSVVTMLLFAAAVVYGFVISLGGQLKFTDDVFD